MRKRNQLRNQANRASSVDLWNSYRSLRNKVTGALRQAKRSFFVSLTSSDYFSKCAASSQSIVSPSGIPWYHTSFNFRHISREEIAGALAKLDTKKVTGMDDIST